MEFISTGVSNMGDLRGIKVVVTWIHLYQWGDAINVRGDRGAIRLVTPALQYLFLKQIEIISTSNLQNKIFKHPLVINFKIWHLTNNKKQNINLFP
jgi:hypothetical protein